MDEIGKLGIFSILLEIPACSAGALKSLRGRDVQGVGGSEDTSHPSFAKDSLSSLLGCSGPLQEALESSSSRKPNQRGP